MNPRPLALLLPILAALSGCTGYHLVTNPAPALDLRAPPPAGMARICVVRPQSRVLSYTAVLHDNGRLVGATQGQTSFCYLAEPGEHRITTEAVRKAEEATAYARAGETYYLEQAVDYGTEGVHISVAWIDPAAAEAAARGCRSVVLTAAPGHEVLPQIGAVLPARPARDTEHGSQAQRASRPRAPGSPG